MSRDVTFQVHFDSDRSMRVVVPGPEGPVDVGSTRESADVGRIAGEGVRSVFGSGQVDFALRVDRPPWLDESTLVRLASCHPEPWRASCAGPSASPDSHSALRAGRLAVHSGCASAPGLSYSLLPTATGNGSLGDAAPKCSTPGRTGR